MLLSILMPSKNNPDYLRSAAQGFIDLGLNLTSDSELVLVDNSSTENCFLKNLNNRGIVYDWSPSKLDMLANFNRAIKLAKGKYVCILGDDDFVLASIFDTAKLLDENSIDCAIAELAPYYWPGVNTFWVKNNDNGLLEVPKSKLKYKPYDLKEGLRRVLNSGGCEYINILPSAYHGLVKTSILQMFLEKYGTAFPGPSPDISNAVLLALHNVSCYKVSPFVVSGAGFGSAAAEGASHAHHGELNERAGFIKRGDFTWPNNVPQFFCGPTMWAVSVIHTLEFTNSKNIIKQFNSSYLHAACLLYHPKYYKKIYNSFAIQKDCNLIGFVIGIFSVAFQRVSQFVHNWVKYSSVLNVFSKWKVVKNLANTSEVGDYVGK